MDVITRTVDARGQSCPGPLVTLARALKDAVRGDLFELLPKLTEAAKTYFAGKS